MGAFGGRGCTLARGKGSLTVGECTLTVGECPLTGGECTFDVRKEHLDGRGVSFAVFLMPKSGRKGGTSPQAGGPSGRPMSTKVPRGRPQERLPDHCGGWKSDEVLHFSRAWHGNESVGVGERASARPRADFFLREAGPGLGGLSSVSNVYHRTHFFDGW